MLQKCPELNSSHSTKASPTDMQIPQAQKFHRMLTVHTAVHPKGLRSGFQIPTHLGGGGGQRDGRMQETENHAACSGGPAQPHRFPRAGLGEAGSGHRTPRLPQDTEPRPEDIRTARTRDRETQGPLPASPGHRAHLLGPGADRTRAWRTRGSSPACTPVIRKDSASKKKKPCFQPQY